MRIESTLLLIIRGEKNTFLDDKSQYKVDFYVGAINLFMKKGVFWFKDKLCKDYSSYGDYNTGRN